MKGPPPPPKDPLALGILATRWAIKGKGEEGSGMSTP